MDQKTIKLMFSLIGSAISGNLLSDEEKGLISEETVSEIITISNRHDIAHLVIYSLDKNSLLPNDKEIKNEMFKAIYRYERMNFEYKRICSVLEKNKIPFLPLKGSVLRAYYPEPWMRTSSDIDILVHPEDLDIATLKLVNELQYTAGSKATHDISLYSKQGVHLELHFDLIEEYCAGGSNEILASVWDNVSLKEGFEYFYEMKDEMFYFYHIAHMAKHFESGGCGIRSFIDLWILDNIKECEPSRRNEMLEQNGLLKFAAACKALSRFWFKNEPADEVTFKMQNYILDGGIYGTYQNKVALNRQSKGGRFGYIFSRIFISYPILKRYYPILKRHKWLMPFMQIRRWMKILFDPEVRTMAKSELSANNRISKDTADKMQTFLGNIGL